MNAPLRLFTSTSLVLFLFSQAVLIHGQTHGAIKYLMPSGGKEKEVAVSLVLAEDDFQIVKLESRWTFKRVPYSDVKAATYSFSKHRRWRAGIAVAVVANMFAAPLFFMKGKKHWLTFETEEDRITLRLNKKNYEKVLVLFESQSGLSVERVVED